MGTLIPEDFPIASLKNDAERRVVEVFRRGLADDWLILPNVMFSTRYRDHEIDVVLIHRFFGVAVIEVKSHKVEIRQGRWFSGKKAMDPQPTSQLRDNMYALRDTLRDVDPLLVHLEVEGGLAFPNVEHIDGLLPSGLDLDQVLTAPRLAEPQEAVEALMSVRLRHAFLSEAQIKAIVDHLCPDAEFVSVPDAGARAARERLDQRSSDQVAVLATLDLNRRVAVTGAAGTGKTRLAKEWARRAWRRDERVLLTCYNEPLAAEMRAEFVLDEEEEARFRIGVFLSLALSLEGMPALAEPAEGGDFDWWTRDVVDHLGTNWDAVTECFDTIVVDEAQDLSGEWVEMLERLLDPDGSGRLLLVVDARQDLYDRGFEVPSAEDGWVRCDLTNNCRNAHAIARLLRSRFGGAAAPAELPFGDGVSAVVATDIDSAAKAVSDQLTRVFDEDGQSPESVMVVTTASSVRDDLRDRLYLVPWERRTEGFVVCENAHRAKGLEADTVILVSLDDDVREELLYVGISRAIGELVVVGTHGLLNRLGLKPG